ncbi:MAG: CAAD domain-containing protein [Cyanobacteriota bacterium]|jgi:CAAD domains of cyanobacterial aminoacyl-tRNA synthetase|nr:CAAD domain-containing protein [Cyanobacteriota bacterium]
MSDATTETPDVKGPESESGTETTFDFQQRYGEVVGKVNETLDKVDWSQLGKFGKAAGILLAVIIAQILIKGVLDTINLLPIVPGLLELLGLVVVGNWAWANLTTSEKRSELMSQVDQLKKEYLG